MILAGAYYKSSARKTPSRSYRELAPDAFFFLCLPAICGFLITWRIALHPLLIPATILALLVGLVLQRGRRRRECVLAFPLLILSSRLLPFALYTVAGIAYWNLIFLSVAVLTFYALTRCGRGVFTALAGSAVLTILLQTASYSVVSTTRWIGDCATTSDDVLSLGGVLLDERGAYAIRCEIDSPSVFVSFPEDNKILKVLPFEKPILRPMEEKDSSFVLDTDAETGDVIAFLKESQELVRYNVESLDITRRIDLGPGRCAHPLGIAHDTTRNMYLMLCREFGSLFFANFNAQDPPWRLKTHLVMPSGLAVSKHMERAYLSDLFGSRLLVIDLETRVPVGEIALGPAAWGIVTSPDGKTLYIGRPLHGRIDVYDAESLKRQRRVSMGRGMGILRMDPEGRFLVAAAPLLGTISVWDQREDRVFGPYQVGRPIWDLAYCSRSRRVYFTTPCAVRYLDIRLMMSGN